MKPPLIIILNTWFFSSKISGYLVTSKPKKHASISFSSNLTKTKNKMIWRKHNRSLASGWQFTWNLINSMFTCYLKINYLCRSKCKLLFCGWSPLVWPLVLFAFFVCLFKSKNDFQNLFFCFFNLRTFKTEKFTNCIRKIQLISAQELHVF